MSSFNQGTPSVNTLINSSNCIVLGNTTSGTALTVQQLGAGAVMNVATSTGSSALFVSSTGQVGVGTGNPAGPLQVSNVGGTTMLTVTNQTAFIANTAIAAGGYSAIVQGNLPLSKDPAGGYDPSFDDSAQLTIRTFTGIGAYGVGNLRIGVSSNTTASSFGYAYLMGVNTFISGIPISLQPRGGNVGIGTASPGYLLDLCNGDIRTQNGGNVSGVGGAINFGANAGYGPMAQIKGALDTAAGSVNDQGSVVFLTRPLESSPYTVRTNLTERMRITSGGNVGIGINNPTSTLQIGTTGVTGNVLQIGNFTFQMVSYQGLYGAGTVTYTPSGSGIFVAYYACDTMVFTSSGTPSGQYSAVTTYLNSATLTGNGGLGQLSLSTAVNGVLTATFKGSGDYMRVFRMAF